MKRRQSGSPAFGLALSGGGARGVAHLGVLGALHHAGLHANRVAGTSAGALVGLFYCLGYDPDEMLRIARDVLSLGPLARSVPGGAQLAFAWMLRSGTLGRRLRRHLSPSLRLEDLPTPLAICATDQQTRATVVLERGEALPAVLASLALPLVAAPVTIDGRRLVDGGLSNNFPLDILARHSRGVNLGVNVGEQRRESNEHVVVHPDVLRYPFGSLAPFEQLVAEGTRAGAVAVARLLPRLAEPCREHSLQLRAG